MDGIDLTTEAGQTSPSLSWHVPHPIFAVVMVGPPDKEVVFGLQKDLLVAQSPFFREYFDTHGEGQLEHLIKLPDADAETFGCFQNYVYTGNVYDKRGGKLLPDYPLLMSLWNLATKLKMAPLRIAILDTMAERRRETSCIPGTPILIQAWQETEEGSGLRKMLIQWTAEHMRASPDIRNAFAKSLPHEILTELVVVMSDGAGNSPQSNLPHPSKHALFTSPLENEYEPLRPPTKKLRISDTSSMIPAAGNERETKPKVKKPTRKSDPGKRNVRRVSSGSTLDSASVNADQDLEDCRALIRRILSAPSYWTRYIKSFREPVDPVRDQVPNYFAVVKRPMDLTTISRKMQNNEYRSAGEFETDVRLIFQNCFEYWTQDDPVFKEGEEFEKFFNKQWAARHDKSNSRIKAETAE